MTPLYTPHRARDSVDEDLVARLGDADRLLALGTTPEADALDDVMRLDAFVDDGRGGDVHRGRPVVTRADVRAGDAVVSCVTNARPHTAMARLRETPATVVTDVLTVAAATDGRVPPPAFVEESRRAYAQEHARWDAVRDLLADDESRTTFDRVSRYRLEGDLDHTRVFPFRPDEQYFEPFLELRRGDVFVDGGAYDGATTLGFLRRCPDHGGAHVFEPDPASMAAARELLADHDDVHFHEQGLYDHRGQVRFADGGGSASAVSPDGATVIEVTTLDEALGTRPTVVKLDLEGAEMAALRGMRELVASGRSRFAISVYHAPTDLWEVPEFVLGVDDRYEVRLRHYTESWTETVMFFTPASR